ncbi:MAG TPA: rhodanese-like domain-containing protein [Flavobacteriales bacterium]|nr:rhodanese-like domain-containing protein [Flavobacteriales bacterium]
MSIHYFCKVKSSYEILKYHPLMKNFLLLVVLLPFFAVLNSCDAQQGKYIDVSKEEFNKLISGGKGILLDVRTPDEFNAGKIEGAINLDYFSEDFEEKVSMMDKSIPVYVYCASGGRSGLTKALMQKENFEEVYNLAMGYEGWISK